VRWGDGGEDDVSGGGAYTHMTMLATSTEGMHRLFRLSSLASLEGYYYKPRMDKELLAEHVRPNVDLIATTGCPSGEIQTYLRMGNYEAAKRSAGEYREIFGADNFFCELMDHGIPIERRAQKDLIRLAKDLAIPFVATNDLHYTHPEDAKAHEVLLCVQSGKTMADPQRFKFDAQDFYLKSPREMRTCGASSPRPATTRCSSRSAARWTSRRAATSCRGCPSRGLHRGHLAARAGARRAARPLRGRVGARGHTRQADYEVDVIVKMGFPGYFLVTADLCRHAKETGIRVGPGRGSAAGSLVAYALRITDLDPIKHKLLFERFLNPERISMPDIDLDFDERRRGDMIRYATEKYGEERVSQIITYGRSRPRPPSRTPPACSASRTPPGTRSPRRCRGGDGQGHPAVRDLRPEPQALRRGRRVPRALRERPDAKPSSTPPAGSRGSSASGACTPPASSCAASRCSTSSRSTAGSRTARSSPSSTWVPARRSAC
jgi:DNA polymerase-3 subunit alpha